MVHYEVLVTTLVILLYWQIISYNFMRILTKLKILALFWFSKLQTLSSYSSWKQRCCPIYGRNNWRVLKNQDVAHLDGSEDSVELLALDLRRWSDMRSWCSITAASCFVARLALASRAWPTDCPSTCCGGSRKRLVEARLSNLTSSIEARTTVFIFWWKFSGFLLKGSSSNKLYNSLLGQLVVNFPWQERHLGLQHFPTEIDWPFLHSRMRF